MKKLAALSILFILLTAAAFAQFKAGLEVDFEGDILRTAAPMDQAKDTSKDDPFQGGTSLNNGGRRGYETRYFDFLNSAEYWNGSGVKVNLSYDDPSDKDDPKYHGEVQIVATQMLMNLLYNQNNANVVSLMMSPFGDWNVWGKVGILKGFIGNTANRGATADARGLNYAVTDADGKTSNKDFVAADFMKNKFEGLGIMKMASLPFYVFGTTGFVISPATKRVYDYNGGTGYVYNDVDVSNLKPITDLAQNGHSFVPPAGYAYVEANLKPITVSLAGAFNNAFGTYDPAYDYNSHASVAGALRVSGDLFDMLKFDAIYKLTGYEQTTDENEFMPNEALPLPSGFIKPNAQPNEDGDWKHNFGIFGNVNLLNNTLGVTLGYSGEIIAQENTGDTKNGLPNPNAYWEVNAAGASTGKKRDTSFIHPYYSGIDLRATFNGIDKLHLAFNNNLSFAFIKGQKYDTYTIVNGIHGFNAYPLDDPEKSQGYFGMYNALMVDFDLTDALVLSFEAGNRWYSWTYEDKTRGTTTDVVNPNGTVIPRGKDKDIKSTMDADELNISLGANYSITSHVTLGTGLAFNIYHQTWTQTDYDDVKAGLFTFGIPLKVKVVY